MLELILFVILGFLMAYFATENTLPISLTIAGNTITGIPVYVIVIASLLMGIFLSWIIHLTNSISSEITLKDKESELKTATNTIKSLTKEKHDLQNKITELRDKVDEAEARAYENLKSNKGPSLIDKVKHNLSNRHSYS